MKRIAVFVVLVALGIPVGSSLAQIAKCREMLQHGDAVGALNELQSVVALSPKSAEAWALMGKAYVAVGRGDSAIEAARKAISIDDEYPEGYVALSRAYVLEKNFPEAYKILYKGLKSKKFNSVLLEQLGDVHVEADSLDNAVLAYSLAKDGDPTNIGIVEKLGDAYMKQPAGATMAAIQYDKAISMDSTRADIYYKMAQAYMKDRRYNDAAEALMKVVSRDPNNSKALLEVATLYYKGKLWASAAKWFGQYVAHVPDSPEANSNYMEALYMSKQYKEAMAEAEKVYAGNPQSKLALRVLAQSSFENGLYEKSVEYYGKLKAVDSLAIPDLKRIARAYLELKNDSLAIIPLEEIIKRDPAASDILNLLGSMYIKTKQYDKASALYAGLYEKDPTNQALLFQFVTTNFSMQKWDVAQSALSKFLETQPGNLKAHYYLAKAYSYMDKPHEAQKEYQAVIELAKDSSDKYATQLIEAYALNGFYYLLEKRYPNAIENLTTSIKMKDDIAQYRLWRAQAYALSEGRKDEAIKEYRATLKLDPKNKQAKKELDSLSGGGD